MEFNFYQIKNRETWWVDAIFYMAGALLAIAIFCYCILAIKIYFQRQQIAAINEKISQYGTPQDKEREKNVLGYKKNIDDFLFILGKHALSSNILVFIENNTLPEVWFSNFNMSEAINELRLSGEAKDMEALSRQLLVFEQSRDYVKKVTVVNSKTLAGTANKVVFLVDISLNPAIFKYTPAQMAPTAQTPTKTP